MGYGSDKTILCIGISVLDIVARPVGAPDSWREKQRIESITLMPGGDAVNQSIHLASLGEHVIFNGCVGEDSNGESLRASLALRGVDTGLMRVKKGAATGTALLLVSSEGERHIFSVQGAHSTLDRFDLPEDIPDDCAAVSLGSLFGMPIAEEEGLAEFLGRVRERGIPVFADLDSGRVVPRCDRVRKLMPFIDYLLPSSYDILPMTGSDSVEEAAAKLQAWGAGHVIVKCGADGAIVFEKGGKGPGTKIPAAPVSPVDTSGAGDCMSAAFIYRIVNGDDIRTAACYACAAGSYSTLFPGTHSFALTDRKVRHFMEEHV